MINSKIAPINLKGEPKGEDREFKHDNFENPISRFVPEKKAATKGLDMIITGSLFGIFFLIPLFFTGLVAQGIGFDKMFIFYFLCLLGLVAWTTKGVINGELRIKRTPFDWPFIGLIIIFIISTLYSIDSKDSLIGSYGNSVKSLVGAIIFILFFYLLVSNLDKRKIKLFFWGLIGSTTLVVIYSLFQLFSIYILPVAITKANSFNPIGSLSGLTMFLTIALPLFLVAIAQVKDIHPKLNSTAAMAIKAGTGLAALASLTILALLNGFTFWPVVIVNVVIILMFFFSRIIKISNNNLIIPIAAFILCIILFVLGNFSIINLNLPVEVNLSRSQSWQVAKSTLAHDPIFGSGPSTYYYDFSKYHGPDFNLSPLWNVRFDNPTGLLFDSLATVGSFGTLAFLIILLILLSVSFLALVKENDPQISPIFLSLFAALVGMIVLGFMFAINNALLMIFIIITLFTAASAVVLYPGQFKVLKLSFRASPKYGLALAAIFLTVSAGVVILFTIGLKMYLADMYANKSVLESDNQKKADYLNKAISLAPNQDNYYLSLANTYMAIANQEAMGSKRQTEIENDLRMAIDFGKKGVDLMAPNKAGSNELLALIYENASFYTRGALEWAENYYKKVMELEPDNPTPYLRIALINMARSNAETDKTEKELYINEAIKKYDEAIAKKKDFAAAYYGKSIAEEKLAKLDDAIEQLKQAVVFSPNNPDYVFELGRLFFNRGVINPNIAQNASSDIAKGQATSSRLSVQPEQTKGSFNGRNDDLNNAEQIFMSLLKANPNHANALYSLAMLYQKVGETDSEKKMVAQLLTVLQDEPTKEAVRKQFPGME